MPMQVEGQNLRVNSNKRKIVFTNLRLTLGKVSSLGIKTSNAEGTYCSVRYLLLLIW